MKQIKIPFDSRGQQDWPYEYSNGFHWKDNYEFKGPLWYIGYHKGRSAQGFYFEDEAGRRYYMFMKDMDTLLKTNTLVHGKVYGTWTFIKRGLSYGIQQVNE